MIKKKRLITWLSLATIFLAIGFAFPALLSQQSLKEGESPLSQIPTCTVAPSVPQEIVFAGETLSLTRSDLRERFDRELITFTYSHTLTLLMLKRANRFFPIVEPILKSCGVPDDLKYLMVIESNLDINAKSTANAAGLWQFIESTGRKYGLEINKNIDERYNIEKATRAACNYLKDSYEMFGDWMTVAASYNAGQAGIAKRLEEQQANKAFDLWLNPETSRYIFRLLVAKEVLSNPQQYGFLLKEEQLYPNIPPLKIVKVNYQISNLATFAHKYHLTLSQLKEANPWMRENHLQNKTRRTYSIIIPDSAALNYNPKETKAHNKNWVID